MNHQRRSIKKFHRFILNLMLFFLASLLTLSGCRQNIAPETSQKSIDLRTTPTLDSSQKISLIPTIDTNPIEPTLTPEAKDLNFYNNLTSYWISATIDNSTDLVEVQQQVQYINKSNETLEKIIF